MSNRTAISTLDHSGSFDCYIARPHGTPKAAVIVIQEIFGVNSGIRQKCDTLAQAGYLALAPDLFWKLAPGIELDADVPDELQQAFGLFGQFDQDGGISDLQATVNAAREMLGDKHAKVGCVGYCLGGRLAFMLACRSNIDAAVGYYGVGIDGLIHELHGVSKPVMLHIPTADHFVGPDVQRAMHDALDGNPHFTLHDYEGLDHGFAAQMGARRDETAAQLADSRTAAFFAAHLE